MKRYLSTFLAVAMIFALTGCSQGVSQEEYDKVVAELNELKTQTGQPTSGNAENKKDAPQTTKPSGGKFDAAAVKEQLEVTPYQWKTKYSSYAALEIKNNSEFTVNLSANIELLDANGAIIGAGDVSEDVIPAGGTILLSHANDEEFADFKYNVTPSENAHYVAVTQNIEMKSSQTEQKVIATLVNNGEVPASYVKVTALFFKDGVPIQDDSVYCVDDDSELKPGVSKSCELKSYESYDEVKLYMSGQADK